MDYSNLKVINLVQNKYAYKFTKRKKQSKSLISTFAFFLVSITMLCGLKLINNNYASEIVSTTTYISKPIYPLYSDIGDIVFTSNNQIVKLSNHNNDYQVPVIYRDVIEKENCIEFLVASPIVGSIEKGVVSDIYVIGNNVKCIKIKHSKNIYSIIENVDILGVNIGALVNKNQKIGTAKIGENIRVYIEINGEQKSIKLDGKNICIN